ncbi:unnamed protein product [Cuscuta europaea]|nr:unnamed protein product [Cuscuta europaea]
MATDSVQPNFNPGEPSVPKTEGQAMMEHIKEWRSSLLKDNIIEVISPTPSVNIPTEPHIPSPPTSTETPPPENPQPKSPEQKTPTPPHSPKQKIASPCRAIVPFRNRSPSPPPSPPQQNASPIQSSPQHQNPSPQQISSSSSESEHQTPPPESPPPHQLAEKLKPVWFLRDSDPTTVSPISAPQGHSRHSTAPNPSFRKKKKVTRNTIPIYSSYEDSSDMDGFMVSKSYQATSKRQKTPPLTQLEHELRVQSLSSVQEHHPLPKGRGLEMPPADGQQNNIPFNKFVESAEDFGGQILQGMDKLIEINDKHYGHLAHVNDNLNSGMQFISDRFENLTGTLNNFIASSSARTDVLSTEVVGIHKTLSIFQQTLLDQGQAINTISEHLEALKKSDARTERQLTSIEEMCRAHQEQAQALLSIDRDRYQKMVLLEANNKDIFSAIQKQQGLIEGLTSVTQTLPEAFEQIASTQASEFQKISPMIEDMHDAKRGEEDPQQTRPRSHRTPTREPSSAEPTVDPAPYFEAALQKKRAAGIPRPPSPVKKGIKKKKVFNFTEWRLGGSQRIDRAQFEDMKAKMTPTQQQHLYSDKDGVVRVRYGGSLEEAEEWYKKNIVPGKTIHEGVLSYLDCKLSPIWASYQSSGNLSKIRAEINEELLRLQRLEEEALQAANLENV